MMGRNKKRKETKKKSKLMRVGNIIKMVNLLSKSKNEANDVEKASNIFIVLSV